ncbi:hypothetical protein KA531_03635 [Candidatus Saccharibacteria bacterium]|nr:hypothetical protein [Candidatus Saccharibacteria bacterium]
MNKHQVFYSQDLATVEAFKKKFPFLVIFNNPELLINHLAISPPNQLILDLGKGQDNAIAILTQLTILRIEIPDKLILTNQPFDDLSLRVKQLLDVRIEKKSTFKGL